MAHSCSNKSFINLNPSPSSWTKTTAVFTCTDDFFYFHAGDVDLFGKLVDGVVGVLVGERIDVHFDAWRN